MGVMNKLWEQASDFLNNELIQPVVLADGTLSNMPVLFHLLNVSAMPT
jgi:hypothetical protein